MFTLLYGAPGCGKTALVEAAFGENMYTLMGTGDTEVSDLIGSYVQTPSGGFEWVDGNLVKAAEEGAVYFVDEVGLIDPKVLSVLYGLMDGRRELTITANPERGSVKAHENFYVVAACPKRCYLASRFKRRWRPTGHCLVNSVCQQRW
jgi:MoxR-like ATPase